MIRLVIGVIVNNVVFNINKCVRFINHYLMHEWFHMAVIDNTSTYDNVRKKHLDGFNARVYVIVWQSIFRTYNT